MSDVESNAGGIGERPEGVPAFLPPTGALGVSAITGAEIKPEGVISDSIV